MSLLWKILLSFSLNSFWPSVVHFGPKPVFPVCTVIPGHWGKPLAVLPSLRVSRTTVLLRKFSSLSRLRRKTYVNCDLCRSRVMFVRMIQQWSLFLFIFSNVFILSIHFLPFRLLSYSPPFRICLLLFSVASSFHRFLSFVW